MTSSNMIGPSRAWVVQGTITWWRWWSFTMITTSTTGSSNKERYDGGSANWMRPGKVRCSSGEVITQRTGEDSRNE